MHFTEKLLAHVTKTTNNGSTRIKMEGMDINFAGPYPRIPILDAIKAHTGYDLSGKNEKEIYDVAKDLGIDVDQSMGKGKLIDEIFGEKCEAHFIQPTFITDYPVEMSPLCKKHRDNPELTDVLSS